MKSELVRPTGAPSQAVLAFLCWNARALQGFGPPAARSAKRRSRGLPAVRFAVCSFSSWKFPTKAAIEYAGRPAPHITSRTHTRSATNRKVADGGSRCEPSRHQPCESKNHRRACVRGTAGTIAPWNGSARLGSRRLSRDRRASLRVAARPPALFICCTLQDKSGFVSFRLVVL